MCVRYACSFTAREISTSLNIDAINSDEQNPRLNVAPHTKNPVVHIHADQCTLDYMQWGLNPEANLATYNCRVESLKDLKPLWKCVKTQRAVAIMDGYYEWQYKAIDRIPYFFHTDSRLSMALAIWEDYSYSIVTKQASDAAGKVHPRMPILVDWETAQRWIKGDWPEVLELVHNGIEPKYHRVSKLVNKVQNQGPNLTKKIATIDLGVWAKSHRKNPKDNSGYLTCPSELSYIPARREKPEASEFQDDLQGPHPKRARKEDGTSEEES